jgi:hypothetical protein
MRSSEAMAIVKSDWRFAVFQPFKTPPEEVENRSQVFGFGFENFFSSNCRIRQNKRSVINVLCVIEAKAEKKKKKK